MYIVHVSIKVKQDAIQAFREATIQNAQNSLLEKGVARFDVLQQKDDAAKFMLVEIYRSTEDQAKHRQTEHFKKWREDVAELIAEPYTIATYDNVFPDDSGWE
ncbi:MAG: putative quinol monooxygenase [Bacillota bacterium]|nr:putative quinol monooxygenase [Bacillota bacterium]